MREKLSNLEPTSYASNVGEDLRSAMDQLCHDKSLIIRQADKSSCIVVLDASQYIEEGLLHLSDTSIYQKLDKDKTQEVVHRANWAIRHHAALNTISRWQEGILYKAPEDTRAQKMYFLRKVHKNPHNIRPIVSCSSGPTEKIFGYLCNLLNPHLQDIKCLVTISQQVIQTIETLDLSAYPHLNLVPLDVKSLYLSIPQAIGIEMVLQRIIPTSPPQCTRNASKNFARDLLKIIIRDNSFRFHDNFFMQTKGVTMGTKCAPPFANLFMGSLEEQALASWTGTHPLLWLRFLDDILMLWIGTNLELNTFLQHLNSRMTSIKFTMEKSQSTITFLDLEKILQGPPLQLHWSIGH